MLLFNSWLKFVRSILLLLVVNKFIMNINRGHSKSKPVITQHLFLSSLNPTAIMNLLQRGPVGISVNLYQHPNSYGDARQN